MQALAATPSDLPMDASALEASISALKGSISALESSLKILEGSSAPWECLAIVSAFVVFFGIVGEIIVIISEDREDKENWARGIVRPPDRAPRWRFWFDIVATVVVLLGVLGEAWGSLELASINSQLRSKTSELRAKSDQLLALVTREAGDAVANAKLAKDTADAVGEEAKKAEAKLASVNRRADVLAYFLSARRVQDESGLENDLRKEFSGEHITFASYVGDEEAFWLCSQLVEIARKAGVEFKDKCATKQLLKQLPITDLHIDAPTIDEGQRLSMVLNKPKRVPGYFVGLNVAPEVTVTVGVKPSIPLYPMVKRTPSNKSTTKTAK